jgi:zinc transport system substrate-binding protein
MKKLNILFASTLALCLSALSACGKPAASAGSAPEIQSGSGENTAEVESKDGAQSKPLSIVTTIFPEYDWVRTILGDEAKNTDLKLLLDQGVDLHSYQPTTEDVMSIANSDLFIYVGGESDGWVQDALKNPKNPNRQVINLMDTLGDTVREEETVEGMQEEHEDEEHGDKDGQ